MPQPIGAESSFDAPIFEGTLDELWGRRQEFEGKILRLTVVGSAQQADMTRASRIASIDAIFGKYAHLNVSVEDLHAERQADKLKEDQSSCGSVE